MLASPDLAYAIDPPVLNSQITIEKFDAPAIVGSTTYHGVHPDGRFRIKRDGSNYLVTGVLFELRKHVIEAGKERWTRQVINRTPAFESCARTDESSIVRCQKTGKNYRVVGLFKKLTPKAAVNASTTESAPLGGNKTLTRKKSATDKPRVQISHLSPTYQRQLANIVSQRAAGLDPDVRMSFIAQYLQESKANLYRKMGKDFPLPIKRGKGSFWPMSQIDMYKAGKH